MADFEAIAKKYGQDANLNALRGSSDPMFAGLDPNANWNNYRGSQGAPAASPSASPTEIQNPSPTGGQSRDTFPSGYQFPTDAFPSGFQFPTPTDTRSGTTYPDFSNGTHYYDPGIPLADAVQRGRDEYAKAMGQSPSSPTASGSSWLTGDPTRDPIRQFVINEFGKNGKQPTGAGSGPTDLEYYVDRILQEGGLNSGYDWAGRIARGINGTQPAEIVQNANRAGAPPPPSGFAPTTANNPFDDPVAKQFIDTLNQRIAALQQPHTSPQLDQLNSYLQKYFETLQGPTYTPAQMDLMQTQSLDPLEAQRGAARNQVLQRLASRGIAPSSGIAEKALQDVDKQFNQIRTQTQAGFATKAIDLNRINQQQAAGVAQALANIDQTQFANQENRANQAVQYAGMIPALAQQRFQDAAGLLSGNTINPTSLIAQTMQGNQFQDAQSQQMMMGLFSLLPSLLNVNWSKLFGG